MTYNTKREKLILPEYGRIIQEMVDLCLEIEDRDERQQCAESIVAIMATMNPNDRQQPDYEHKLWDQLAILSDYRLDIDYPFDVVKPEDITISHATHPLPPLRSSHRGVHA